MTGKFFRFFKANDESKAHAICDECLESAGLSLLMEENDYESAIPENHSENGRKICFGCFCSVDLAPFA